MAEHGYAPASASRPFTFADIEALWIALGGNKSEAKTAAAIALAESGGNPKSENHNTDGSIDRGLFQINSVHGSLSTFNIEDNVKAAIKIRNESKGWGPWVTFKTGAYKKFLTPANESAHVETEAEAAKKITPEAAINPLKGLEAIGDLANKLGEWVSDPLRVAKLLGGATLLYLGLRTLTRTSAGATVAGETRQQARGAVELVAAGGLAGGAAKKVARRIKPKRPKGGTT